MGTRLHLDELAERVFGFRRRLFRMETLPAYAVDDDGGDYERWMAGETEPTWERKRPWLDVLRADARAGKVRRRVQIFSARLTAYERYACDWGYALNAAAGEQIRVLRPGEHVIAAQLIVQDFWLVDDTDVLLMHYDEHGRFETAEIADDPAGYLRTRDMAWDAAEPFPTWWARHPQLRQPTSA